VLGDLPNVFGQPRNLRFDAILFQSASYGLHQMAAKTLTNLVKGSYASIGAFLAKDEAK